MSRQTDLGASDFETCLGPAFPRLRNLPEWRLGRRKREAAVDWPVLSFQDHKALPAPRHPATRPRSRGVPLSRATGEAWRRQWLSGVHGIALGGPGCEVTIPTELSWTRAGPLLYGDTSALSRLCKGVPACLGRNDCASGSEGDKCDLAAEIRGSRAKCVMWEHSFCPEPASRGPEDSVSWGLFPGEGGEGGSSGSAGRPGRHHPLRIPPSCWPWAPAGRTAFPVAGPALIRQSALASSVGNGYASSGAGGPAPPRAAPLQRGHLSAP